MSNVHVGQEKHAFNLLLRKAFLRGLAVCAMGLPLANYSSLLAQEVAAGGEKASVQELVRTEEGAWRRAVAIVAPSVVRVETLGGQASVVGKDDFTTAPTTGVVIGEEGLILTSLLQFAENPPSIIVTLGNGQRKPAEIVARDHSRMLVLLKVKTEEKLPVPEMVSRASLRIGQTAIAVGRTLDGDQPTMSLGIVSAKERVWGRAIQTDAKISPLNYGGPLIDLQGRVLGILTPLSAQGTEGDLSGTEWYDVGLGFAVPLDEMKERLGVLTQGKDLHAGLMGIAVPKGDIYSLPAEITGCRLDGPAGRAGLKAKDVIKEIDGHPIVRQAQLKHALGAKYGGDVVRVTVKRGDETLTREVTLVDKIEAYDHPFLGVLPQRGNEGEGVAVRFVYPESPAAKAGIAVGDVIVSFRGEKVANAKALYQAIAPLDQKGEVALEVRTGDQTREVKLSLGRLPVDVPATLPDAIAKELPPAEEKSATGVIELKLPQQQDAAQLLVPVNYDPRVAQGLVIWFYAPKEGTPEKLTERFGEVAKQHQFLVLAAPMSNGEKWSAEDLEMILRFVEQVQADYRVDEGRVVTYAYQEQGAIASAAFTKAYVDRVHGMVMVGTPPLRLQFAMSTEQTLRLAFLLAAPEKSKLETGLKPMLDMLERAKLPVTLIKQPADAGDLAGDDLEAFGRWVDTLDRI